MNVTVKVYFGSNTYANNPIVLLYIDIASLIDIDFITICKKIETLFSNYIDLDILTINEPFLYFGKMISNFSFNLINNNNGLLTSYGASLDEKSILSWVEFDNLEITVKALELFFNLFVALAQNKNLQDIEIKSVLKNYSNLAKNYNNYDLSLLSASKELDIPSFESYTNSLYRQYGWGKNSRIFRHTSPMEDSYHGVFISMDKVQSKKMLKAIGMPIVKDMIIYSKEQLEMAVKSIDYPCVIKPIKGTEAIGISLNISNFTQLQTAYDYAKNSSFGNNPIMIEKFIEGDSYRLLVVRGKFVGSLKKTSPILIGDGKSTIKNIIEQINKVRLDPLQNRDNLKPIEIADKLTDDLKKLDLSLDDILQDKQEVQLGLAFSSYAFGASIENTTDITHLHVKQMAEAIAEITKIDMLGIDYITTDLSKSFRETDGAICEFNHYPGLASLDLWGSKPNRLKVARQIIGENIGRIPVNLIVANETHIGQLHSWFQKNIIQDVYGWICNNSAYIGQLPLNVYELSDWSGVKMLLTHKRLEKLYIICSFQEIMDKGLPLDKFDKIYVDNNIQGDWEEVCQNATLSFTSFTRVDELYD